MNIIAFILIAVGTYTVLGSVITFLGYVFDNDKRWDRRMGNPPPPPKRKSFKERLEEKQRENEV